MNLATDELALGRYDEPGSWGRMSEGWPETPYTPGKLLLCTKAEVVPYGQYVVVGAKQRACAEGPRWFGHAQGGGYDYSEARIRVASVALKEKLERVHGEMFGTCRRWIEAELAGEFGE